MAINSNNQFTLDGWKMFKLASYLSIIRNDPWGIPTGNNYFLEKVSRNMGVFCKLIYLNVPHINVSKPFVNNSDILSIGAAETYFIAGGFKIQIIHFVKSNLEIFSPKM